MISDSGLMLSSPEPAPKRTSSMCMGPCPQNTAVLKYWSLLSPMNSLDGSMASGGVNRIFPAMSGSGWPLSALLEPEASVRGPWNGVDLLRFFCATR